MYNRSISERWTSRRDCHEKCMWWSRDVDDNTSDELIIERQPSGIFYAKEQAPEYYENNVISGTFMVERSTVTLRTPDDVTGIKPNCLVKYQDEIWIVNGPVQRKNIRNGMTEFARENDVPHFYYIQLRK